MIYRIILSAILLLGAWMYNPRGSSLPPSDITNIKLTHVIPNFLFGDGKGFDTINSYSGTISCNHTNTNPLELECIEVSQTFPKINEDWKVLGFDTFKINIFYYHNMEMYQLPYIYYGMIHPIPRDSSAKLSNSLVDSGGNGQQRYFYFIWKKGKAIGLQYYFGDSPIKQVLIDSAVREQWPYMIGQSVDSSIRNFGKLMSVTKTEKGQNLVKIFKLSSMQGDIPMEGTSTLYYNKSLTNIEFTFNPILDTVSGMKLFKIVTVNEAKYIKKYNLHIPLMTTYKKFEIKHDFDERKILELFQKFENDSKFLISNENKVLNEMDSKNLWQLN